MCLRVLQNTLIATRTAAFPALKANWLGRWSYVHQVGTPVPGPMKQCMHTRRTLCIQETMYTTRLQQWIYSCNSGMFMVTTSPM